MKFSAKCLYENGKLIGVKQLAEQLPVIGNFTFDDVNAFRNGILVRKARLHTDAGADIPSELFPLLFEAEVVSVDDVQMVVRGYSFGFDPALGTTIRHRQCWALRPY